MSLVKSGWGGAGSGRAAVFCFEWMDVPYSSRQGHLDWFGASRPGIRKGTVSEVGCCFQGLGVATAFFLFPRENTEIEINTELVMKIQY